MGWGAKKVAAERAAIPAEVLVSIETASMYTRPGDENTPRVIVQPEGWGGFICNSDSAERWISKAFPYLNNEQKTSAVNYLGALVRQHHADTAKSAKRATNWVNRY
ncbi:TPA: hypothetical protein ACNGY8_003902 [Klebsiella michiganensis]